jgi:hypothetical protein
MELWLTLNFRGAPLGLRGRFPPELAFVARQLRSLDGPAVPPNERTSTAHVQATPEQAEAILAWGRMRGVDGRMLLDSARFEERWTAHELAAAPAVELVRPPSLDAPPVVGRSRSHLVRWACSHCDRLRWEQIGDLELALDEPADVELLHRARPELLLTHAGELVVASRLRPVVERHGLSTRPLSGTRSWVQVGVGTAATLAAVHPLEVQGEPCPGCGLQPLGRSDTPNVREVRGDVRILRTVPWKLSQLLLPGVSLGWSEERIGFTGSVRDRPAHAMGAPLDLDLHPGLLGEQGAPVLFASTALACALADAQASGLVVRPVRYHGTAVADLGEHAAPN